MAFCNMDDDKFYMGVSRYAKIAKSTDSRINDLVENLKSILPSYFSDVLYYYEAIIAGGVMSSLYTDKTVKDIDVYVSIYNAMDLIMYLTKIKRFEFVNPVLAGDDVDEESDVKISDTEYDSMSPSFRFGVNTSRYNTRFCRRNRIMFRCNLKKNDLTYDIIVSDKNPMEVVKNFDMTCCEVWFDGKYLSGTDLESFFQKIGYIKPQYIGDKDPILLRRQEKYKAKGFDIKVKDRKETPSMLDAMFVTPSVYRRLMLLDDVYTSNITKV